MVRVGTARELPSAPGWGRPIHRSWWIYRVRRCEERCECPSTTLFRRQYGWIRGRTLHCHNKLSVSSLWVELLGSRRDWRSSLVWYDTLSMAEQKNDSGLTYTRLPCYNSGMRCSKERQWLFLGAGPAWILVAQLGIKGDVGLSDKNSWKTTREVLAPREFKILEFRWYHGDLQCPRIWNLDFLFNDACRSWHSPKCLPEETKDGV